MIDSSFDIFKKLFDLGYARELRDPYWWPNSGSFEVVLGAILTQNTRWENVQKALLNLKNFTTIEPKSIQLLEVELLASLIKPSGFYNQKASRIKNLVNDMMEDFGSFEEFRDSVSREWLLEKRGIGFESADSILCYACYKEEMVVDKYTHRLLNALGVEIDEYEEIKSYLQRGVEESFDKIVTMLGSEDLVKIYAIFHGMIVEFSKEDPKLRHIDTLREG